MKYFPRDFQKFFRFLVEKCKKKILYKKFLKMAEISDA